MRIGLAGTLAMSGALSTTALHADAAIATPAVASSSGVQEFKANEPRQLTLKEAEASLDQMEAVEACLKAQKDALASKRALLDDAQKQLRLERGTESEIDAKLTVQALLRDMASIRATAIGCNLHFARLTDNRIARAVAAARVRRLTRQSGEAVAKATPRTRTLATNVGLVGVRRTKGTGAMGTALATKALGFVSDELSSCYSKYVERKPAEAIRTRLQARFAANAKVRRVQTRRLRPGDPALRRCVEGAFDEALDAYAPRIGTATMEYDLILGPATPSASAAE